MIWKREIAESEPVTLEGVAGGIFDGFNMFWCKK